MIREVNAVDHIAQIQELAAENWKETGFGFELKPSLKLHQLLQDAGVLIALAAFDGDEIVGYSTATVGPHMFNDEVMVCTTSALFVKKSHRGGSIPGRLVIETERAAKRRGAQLLFWQTRAGTELATTLKKRGYIDADVAVMKEI